jgi:protein-disulfide isomerase
VTVAKTQKPSADEPTEKASTGLNRIVLFAIGALVAAAVVGGIIYFRGGYGANDPNAPKQDPGVAALMQTGPLPDIALGDANAPNTIVEYASMTCTHCAQFHSMVSPELKKKYIDTGKARFILREFPLDGLAVAAFMLARCAGPDRYYPMVDGLFETQSTWAVPGADGKEKLLLIAKQAGFSQDRFDKCLADKELFNKIVEVRQRGHEKFGVDSTPSFFIDGKRLSGEQVLQSFDSMLEGAGTTEGAPPPSG